MWNSFCLYCGNETFKGITAGETFITRTTVKKNFTQKWVGNTK